MVTLLQSLIMVVIAYLLGVFTPRPVRAIAAPPPAPSPVAHEEDAEDIEEELSPALLAALPPAEIVQTSPRAPVAPSHREATGTHLVLYTEPQDQASTVLYIGASEAAARDAWETISLKHPRPAGRMQWWKPDGSLRDEWHGAMESA